MKRINYLIIILLVIIFSGTASAMQFVPVGDINNPADPSTGLGAVDYSYRLGKYEVTNSEYAAMLNDAASSDPYGLYNPKMGRKVWDPLPGKMVQYGGIARNGTDGNYSYSVIAGYENKPVLFVSWRDAARFANWMTNNDTESGAYDTSTFGKSNGLFTDQSTHDPQASYWISTVDEWYKAAYYNGSGDYWLYPTQSNDPPIIEQPPGGMSSANGDYVNPSPYITDAGSYINSLSYYGTYDQAGNLWEWTEDWKTEDIGVPGGQTGEYRSLHGGGFFDGPNLAGVERMSSQWQYRHEPIYENFTLGFRLSAAVVPEPSSLLLLFSGLSGLCLMRRKKRDE